MMKIALLVMAGLIQPPAGEPLPDLDELLGLPRQRSEPAPGRALDRELSEGAGTEPFEQAVDLMRRAAERLVARDAGIETQRLQEETLRRLDQLIAQARRQRGRGQQQQQQQQDQRQQQQAGRQSSQEASQAMSEGPGDRTPVGPPRTEGALDPAVVAAGASWGHLPEHVRQALVQGLSDRFSSLYQRLTEEYYRRLAEDSRRRP